MSPQVPADAEIAATLRALVAERGPERSACPSEAARRVALAHDRKNWRALMPAVRRVAAGLAAAGEIVVTQQGVPVDIDSARGPVRIARRA